MTIEKFFNETIKSLNMRLLLLLFTIGILGYACSGGDNNTTSDASNTTTTSKEDDSKTKGAKIYKQFCVACHGLDGKMAINGAKDLSASTLSLEERIEIITNGKTSEAGVMQAFKGLVPEEGIQNVAAYIETLRE